MMGYSPAGNTGTVRYDIFNNTGGNHRKLPEGMAVHGGESIARAITDS